MPFSVRMGQRTPNHGPYAKSPLPEGSLSYRRAQLAQRQQSWKQGVEDDPDLYELLGSGYYELNGVPTQRELVLLHKALTTPGIAEEGMRCGYDLPSCDPSAERAATPKQLIQLLHSDDDGVVLYTLKQIAQRLELDEMDVSHLITAIYPMVKIILKGDTNGDVYWAVLFVLQQLCLEDQHAMTIGDIGGSRALIALIGSSRMPIDGLESVSHIIVNNVLNAIWLICCYEGNGDLAAYDEERGPIVAVLSLLAQLRDGVGMYPLPREAKEQYMDYATSRDEPDPLLILLVTLEKLSGLKAYRGQITSAGGIEQCVPLLTHSGIEHRTTALRVAQNLMVDNSLEFVVLGGVPHVAHMLASPYGAEHAAAERMCLHLFSVRGDLMSLATDLVACGALSACANLVRCDSRDSARRALAVLGLVCRHGPEDYSYLLSREEGFIAALVVLLRDDKLSTLQQATALFWYLARVEEVHQHLVNAGAIPVLNKMLARATDTTLLHNAAGALKRLECFDDLGHDDINDMTDADGLVIHW